MLVNVDFSISYQVEKAWKIFEDGISGPNPFCCWVPEAASIEFNRLGWWRFCLKDVCLIESCDFLMQGAGVLRLKTMKGFFEIGFVLRDENIWFTSAKSVHMDAYLCDWPNIESENFNFLCQDLNRITNQNVKLAEWFYQKQINYLNINFRDRPIRNTKIRYVVCRDSNNLKTITGLTFPSGSSLMDPVTLTILSSQLPDYHEIAHAVVVKYIGGTPPIAYCEGVAESFRYPVGWEEFVRNPLCTPSVFGDLRATAFFNCPSPWAQAGAFCKYIINTFGVESLKEIHRIATIYSFNDCIREITGLTTVELVSASRMMVFDKKCFSNALIQNNV